MRNGLPITSKGNKDFHGYGTLSIRTIAEQYSGGMTIDTSDGIFQVDVVLSANSAPNAGWPITTGFEQITTKPLLIIWVLC